MKPVKKLLFAFLVLLYSLNTFSQNKPRLIAIAGNSISYYKYDSVRYTYSNNRGYDTVADWEGKGYIQFDSSIAFMVSGDTNWIVVVNKYDNSNRKTVAHQYMAYNTGWDPAKLHLAWGDSLVYNSVGQIDRFFSLDNTSGSFAVSRENIFTYNSGGLLTQKEGIDYSQHQNHTKYSFAYDQSGRLTEEIYTHYDNNAWWDLDRTVYTWTGSSPATTTRYNWDGNTNQWAAYHKAEYDYPQTTQKIIRYSNMDTGSWILNQVDSNLYDLNGDNSATYLSRLNRSTGMWMPMIRTLKTYDGQHNLLTATEQLYDSTAGGFVDSRRDLYTYNTNGQLLVKEKQYWNADSAKWVHKGPGFYEVRYYYLDGIPGNVLSNAGMTPDIQLYPNPANDMLRLKITGTAAEKVTLSITGTDGRLHRLWTVDGDTFSEQHIPLHDLPVGNYILTVKGEQSGTEAVNFVVAR